MSLRGIKKQLYRTPHQLFGSKSADDTIIKVWEHDLSTAVAGLEYLKLEEQKWAKLWVSQMTNFIDVIETFKDIHGSLSEKSTKTASLWGKGKEKEAMYQDIDNVNSIPDANGDEEWTKITMYELNQASKMVKLLLRDIRCQTSDSSKTFQHQCDEMIKILKGALKMITKRNHKKMDFDMQRKKVDSASNIKLDSKHLEKDKANLELHTEKLVDIDMIFQDIDQKVKLIIPQILASLSEFIYKLTLKLAFTYSSIQQLISRNLKKFSQSQGLTTSEKLSYEQIIDEFNAANNIIQEKLDNMTLLKEFREFRKKNLKDKTVKSINSAAGHVVDTTINVSSTIYTKTTKPSQKVSMSLKEAPGIHNPVRLSDKYGMFSSSTDPLEFLKTTQVVESMSQGDLLTLSQFPTNISSGPTSPSIRNFSGSSNVTHVVDNQKWMKPLKSNRGVNNRALPEPPSLSNRDLPPIPPLSPSANAPSLYSDFSTTSAVSSIVADKNSETYKVANVTMNKIRQEICKVIVQPEINHCPITSANIDVNEEMKIYVTARSSITSKILSL